MTQHAMLLTRKSEEDASTSQETSTSTAQGEEDGILLTLTLNAAQISAVVSAAQSEASQEGAIGTATDTKEFSSPHTNIKLVNPKSTSTSSHTRHLVSLTKSVTISASDVTTSVAGTKSSASASRATQDDDDSTTTLSTKLFTQSSGGIKAVVTSRTSSIAISSEEAQASSEWTPSTASLATSSNAAVSSYTTSTSSEAQANTSNQVSSPASSSTVASARTVVTVTTTVSSSRAASTYTSTSTQRVFASSIVAKPVVTNSDGVPVVTVFETTGTAFVTAGTPISSTTPSAEKKNFFQKIDSSPTAIALTTIISAGVLAFIIFGIWCCMRRRNRNAKRRNSLFDFAPDANTTSAKSASVYSEKTPIVAAAYPFAGDQASFGYDSRFVEAATSTPARSPLATGFEQQEQASTSAVRFAGIYPTLSPERRKSSVDLGLVYRTQTQSPRELNNDNLSNMADAHSVSPSGIPAVQLDRASPTKDQEQWGQAHDDSPLSVPPRPARPASLSGSITKKIEEMYNPTPRSSFSILPPVPRPWVRQARKWASMSSMGGGTGPDRRPSVDRRLYQQQLPSRFSITTFATSVEASPDLNAFRPRRPAVTEQHIVPSMLRTDIFSAPPQTASLGPEIRGENPFGDHARVHPSQMQSLENPSPMSTSEPWASTSPLALQGSNLQRELGSDAATPTEDSSEGHDTQETLADSNEVEEQENVEEEGEQAESLESLETASEASALDEEEEENIRALIKRRQSASSATAKAL